MAHTNTAARKNPQSRTPSPSPSPSPTRSPSPPPRPTPTHSYSKRTFSDNMSSSLESSPSTITLAPLSIILPPLFQCVTLSISSPPPHLQKTLNTCSSTSSSKRRSMQILAAFYYAEAFADKSLIVSKLKGIEMRLGPFVLAYTLQPYLKDQ
uniref:Uncharacterized protein n=1 Tax=Cicer arietinum TaxID=3827 RepID=A0A3Q7YA51_CICAR|nr:putative uncharacterized protein YHR217C [Cicer arietinum]